LQNLLFEQWQNKIIARQQRLNHQQISQFFTKVDINEESTKVRASEFTPAKSLIVQQQKNADFWLEILAFLLMLLWAIERIASEFFRPKANVGHNQENHKHDSRTIKVTQAIKSAQVDT